MLGHWNSVKGCGASCFGGCSTCPSCHLGWRGKGSETNNSAAPLPGSSAGNTAHPQTRGSVNKGDRAQIALLFMSMCYRTHTNFCFRGQSLLRAYMYFFKGLSWQSSVDFAVFSEKVTFKIPLCLTFFVPALSANQIFSQPPQELTK